MLMEVGGGGICTKLGALQRICEFTGGDSKGTKYMTSRSTREAQDKPQQQVDKQVEWCHLDKQISSRPAEGTEVSKDGNEVMNEC